MNLESFVPYAVFTPTLEEALGSLESLCDKHSGACALDCYVLSEVTRYLRGAIPADQISVRAYRAFNTELHRTLVDIEN